MSLGFCVMRMRSGLRVARGEDVKPFVEIRAVEPYPDEERGRGRRGRYKGFVGASLSILTTHLCTASGGIQASNLIFAISVPRWHPRTPNRRYRTRYYLSRSSSSVNGIESRCSTVSTSRSSKSRKRRSKRNLLFRSV